MQTFLPYPDIIKSVQCLDDKRLGKQRVEAYQILRVLAGLTKGWQQHPAVRMWVGYTDCLEVYMNCCIQEWIRRGFINNMLFCWSASSSNYYKKKLADLIFEVELIYPKWWGNKQLHDSHKSNLLRKYPEHYKQFNWNVPNNLSYYWPTENNT